MKLGSFENFPIFLLGTLLWVLPSLVTCDGPIMGHVDDAAGFYTDCGGIVMITNVTNPTIEYKGTRGSGRYGNNERCLWVIVPEPGLTLQSIVLFVDRQDYESSEVGEPNDGLFFYDADMNERRILEADTGSSIEFKTQLGFLYFTSDEEFTGLGFRISVIGRPKLGSAMKLGTFAFKSNDCSLNFSLSVADIQNNFDTVAIVVQPNITEFGWTLTDLTFEYSNPGKNSDILEVYTLPVFANIGPGPRAPVQESRNVGCSSLSFTKMTVATPRIILYNPASLTGSLKVSQYCS